MYGCIGRYSATGGETLYGNRAESSRRVPRTDDDKLCNEERKWSNVMLDMLIGFVFRE
jgi:hypothetical protein